MVASLTAQLEELHFSAHEAKVYCALLEIGQTSAGEIIKKTRLHRSVVYETLDKLAGRKLLFKLKKRNIAYFQPTDPSRLLEDARALEKVAQALVPKLKKMLSADLPEIIVYEGLPSWRKFWFDMMEKVQDGTIDYVAGSIGDRWIEYMGEEYDRYLQRRIEKNIKWKMIVFEKQPLELELLKKYPKLHEYRIVASGQNNYGNFNLFGEDILVLQSAAEPMIIEIKNQTLVKVFQNIFELLWKMGEPLV